ncbi:hypothetical protein BDV96DRAFT_189133 [Lophiotrema nucula]|uniref:Uncharacterized protein n=1 Tax=Lophiotrema nucula TaxID=690887 RepID=A0A6A5YVW6_9PLEO|nr:hypothetical protein BDV96DRAFT_189133 [Lophiotrema nucula]
MVIDWTSGGRSSLPCYGPTVFGQNRTKAGRKKHGHGWHRLVCGLSGLIFAQEGEGSSLFISLQCFLHHHLLSFSPSHQIAFFSPFRCTFTSSFILPSSLPLAFRIDLYWDLRTTVCTGIAVRTGSVVYQPSEALAGTGRCLFGQSVRLLDLRHGQFMDGALLQNANPYIEIHTQRRRSSLSSMVYFGRRMG